MDLKAPTAVWEIFAFHHAAHAHRRNLDHEAHRADVGDETIENRRLIRAGHAVEVF